MSDILFHSLERYSDMFTSYHCTIQQCNTVLVHKFIATSLHINTTRGTTNEFSYLLEDDDKSIEQVHAVYFVTPIDAH